MKLCTSALNRSIHGCVRFSMNVKENYCIFAIDLKLFKTLDRNVVSWGYSSLYLAWLLSADQSWMKAELCMSCIVQFQISSYLGEGILMCITQILWELYTWACGLGTSPSRAKDLLLEQEPCSVSTENVVWHLQMLKVISCQKLVRVASIKQQLGRDQTNSDYLL